MFGGEARICRELRSVGLEDVSELLNATVALFISKAHDRADRHSLLLNAAISYYHPRKDMYRS